jgi:NADH:ubiquinone oxidoreductase subunit 5 (subunit L)/multisubunit Na+/H+ antiporter MnhA subunit
MSIGSLALAGLPFLAGFYSKETILWALANSGWISLFALCCSLIGAVFTVMYSVRLLYVVFFCSLNSFKVITKFILESDYFVIIPLFILSLLSLIIGFIGFDFFIGTGSNFFVSSLIDVTLNVSFIPYKSLFLMFFISTLLTFFIFYKVASTVKFNLQLIKVSNVKLFNFLSVKWYIDYLYNILVSFCGLCSYYCFLVVDRSVDTITGMVGLLFFYNVKTWFQKYTFYVQLYMNLYVLFTIVVILLVIIQYSIY